MSVAGLLKEVPIPKIIEIAYKIPTLRLENPIGEMAKQIYQKDLLKSVKPGMRIAIAAGSRGITDLPIAIKIIVQMIRDAGGYPFVFPAMGSHGGATAEGQKSLLNKLGISECFVGCPVYSSMETVKVGTTTEGLPVFMDKYAWESDGIIIINRVKPHTSFRGEHESGIVKMLVIGMGKQKGAETCHQFGFPSMSKNIKEIAKLVLSTGKILFGVGLVENYKHETCVIQAVEPSDFFTADAQLLNEAWKHLPKLPFEEIDVLIINEIGKEISGTGFDTNVVGRHGSAPPSVTRIVVLNLSSKTGGNGNGIGRADFTTKKVLEKFSFEETYPNALTSTAIESVKMPMVLENDEDAIKAAIKTSLVADFTKVKLVQIKNTMNFESMKITKTLFDEASNLPGFKIVGKEWMSMKFDKNRNLNNI